MNKYTKLFLLLFFFCYGIYYIRFISYIAKTESVLEYDDYDALTVMNEDDHVFIMIMSGRYNFQKRQDVREMLNVGKYAKFMIGNRPCRVPPEYRHSTFHYCFGGRETEEYNNELEKLEIQVKEEIQQYSDIVELDMIEYYRALPRKLKLSYKWGVEHFPNAKWFFKTDDDCYFNYDNIQNFFKKKTRTELPILYGDIRKNSKVHRSGKWEDPIYKKDKYPPFPIGSSGHCVNRPMASLVVENIDNLFDFQGEDVSLGIWAEETLNPKPKLVSIKHVLPSGTRECKKRINISLACGHDMGRKQFEKILN